MNAIDMLLLILLALIVGLAVRKIYRDKKSGKTCSCGCTGSGGCCGNCRSCQSSSTCSRPQKQ